MGESSDGMSSHSEQFTWTPPSMIDAVVLSSIHGTVDQALSHLKTSNWDALFASQFSQTPEWFEDLADWAETRQAQSSTEIFLLESICFCHAILRQLQPTVTDRSMLAQHLVMVRNARFNVEDHFKQKYKQAYCYWNASARADFSIRAYLMINTHPQMADFWHSVSAALRAFY